MGSIVATTRQWPALLLVFVTGLFFGLACGLSYDPHWEQTQLVADAAVAGYEQAARAWEMLATCAYQQPYEHVSP